MSIYRNPTGENWLVDYVRGDRPAFGNFRDKGRNHTKAGPGRMPFTRTAKPVGSKLWGKCPDKKRDLWAEDEAENRLSSRLQRVGM